MRSCLLALILTVVAACPALAEWSRPLSPAAGRVLHQARQLEERGEDARAGEVLAEYVASSKNPHPYGCLLYGNWLMRHDKMAEAARVYEDALQRESDSPDIALNLGVVRYHQERFVDAGDLFLRAADASEKPRHGWKYHAAACYYSGEEFGRAATVLEGLLAQPKVKAGWVKLYAHCLVSQKRWAEAEATLLRFLRVRPEQAEYWRLLASVRSERSHYKDAAAALEIAYRLKAPSHSERETLSQLYAYVGAPLLATKALEKSFAEAPSAKVCERMARTYMMAGRRAEAAKALERAIAQEPTAQRWLWLGRILYKERDMDAAQSALGRAVALGEETGQASYLLGLLEWDRRNWNAARRHFCAAGKCRKFKRHAQNAIASLDALVEAEREAEAAATKATQTAQQDRPVSSNATKAKAGASPS